MIKKIYTQNFINLIKDLSKNGAVIYGGSSLVLRLILENIEPYRRSINFDIKKVNKFKNKSSAGPSSQFKPLKFTTEYFKGFLKDELLEVHREKNEGGRFVQHFDLIMKNGESILLKFYRDFDKNVHEVERLYGINFIKIEKILADKIHAFTKTEMREASIQDNNVRHIIDILHIASKYNIENELMMSFLNEKIEQESKLANKLINSDDSEKRLAGIFLADLNSKLLIHFEKRLKSLDANIIKNRAKDNAIYFSLSFVNDDNIELILEVINGKI